MSGCLLGRVEVVRTCSHPENPWEEHTSLCLLVKGLPEGSCRGDRTGSTGLLLQSRLFWLLEEIALITPAARSRIWGRARTSNKNLRLQEIWKATAAPDSCPSKLDYVLRGDCTHEQSGLWWACQMTLIADHKMDCFHRQEWPSTPPLPALDQANNEVRNHEERPNKCSEVGSNCIEFSDWLRAGVKPAE